MRRRDFITVISGVAAGWPFAARAQQPSIPVIGFLSFRSANESAGSEAAFREGLSEIGYSDGRNVHIAFRWAEGQKDRLPVLAADLVDNLHVAIIAATGGGPSPLAAKAATKTIPIVFTFGADPVKAGIVASLNRPEENITGVTWFAGDLAGKRLALLHDIVPNLATVGLLANPRDPEDPSQRADAQDTARRLNLKLVVMDASTEREIDVAFATFAEQKVGAVVIASDPFLFSRREQIVGLAARQTMPMVGSVRDEVAAGCGRKGNQMQRPTRARARGSQRAFKSFPDRDGAPHPSRREMEQVLAMTAHAGNQMQRPTRARARGSQRAFKSFPDRDGAPHPSRREMEQVLAMILAHDANPDGSNFRKGQVAKLADARLKRK